MAFLPSGANSVKLLDPLKKPIQDINKRGQASLADTLGRVGSREVASANATGRIQGSYIPETLDTAGVSAGHGIENALSDVLGQSSYKDYESEKDFQRNMEMAKYVGDLNKPSTLQEVLGGIGDFGKALGGAGSLYSGIKKQKQQQNAYQPSYGSSSNPYYADLSRIRGYEEYPNMMRRSY